MQKIQKYQAELGVYQAEISSTVQEYQQNTQKEMQLWISWVDKVESAVLTQIIDYPQFKVCRWFLAGGKNADAWLDDLTRQVETWAIANNVKRIELVGRKGWIKKLKDYEAKHIVMIKELKYE